MTTLMIILFVWAMIGTICFHIIMPENDRQSMYQNKISLIVFMAFAPLTVAWVTLKTMFNKI